jgi:hypothetical protein
MLAYFLWMGRQSERIQWAFLIVTYFGQRIMRNLASSNPTLGLVLWPLLVLFYVFVYLSWTAVPLFNLLLRLDRYGRHVLSRKERRGTNWFGASVLLILAAGGWWLFGNSKDADLGVIIAAMLSVCVAATVVRENPRNRLIFGGATAALALCAVAGLVVLQSAEGGFVLLLLFFLGFFVFQIAANMIKG